MSSSCSKWYLKAGIWKFLENIIWNFLFSLHGPPPRFLAHDRSRPSEPPRPRQPTSPRPSPAPRASGLPSAESRPFPLAVPTAAEHARRVAAMRRRRPPRVAAGLTPLHARAYTCRAALRSPLPHSLTQQPRQQRACPRSPPPRRALT